MKSLILEKKPLFLWLGLIFIKSIFISLVLAAPLIHHRWPQLSTAIYMAYDPFCHQIEERCFTLAGEPLAVCARCFGIIAGFFLSLIIYPLTRKLTRLEPPGPALLIGLSIPVAIDLAGNWLHFWSSPNWLRFFIGAGWGFSIPFHFFPAAMSLWGYKVKGMKLGNKENYS